MRRVAVSLLISAIAVCGEQLPYRVFTTADGLVRNTITRIRRDPKGYLWICTVEGLSLFDGSRFTNYTAADGLPDRHVNDLLPARDGSYWLATSSGLFRFRPRRALAPGQNQNPGFDPVSGRGGSHSGSVGVLLEDTNGVIWAGGRSGLCRVPRHYPRCETVAMQPPGSPVLALSEDTSGRLWIGARDGLYRFSEASGSAVRVFEAADVAAVHIDEPGRLWIGGRGLTRLNVEADPPVVLEHLGKKEWPGLFGVAGMRESSGGAFWIAGFGLSRFQPNLSGPHDRVRSLEVPAEWVQFIKAIETDGGGNVWAGVSRMGLLTASARGVTAYSEADGLASTKIAGMITGRQRPLVITIDQHAYTWNEFDGNRFFKIVPRLPTSISSLGWGSGGILHHGRDGDWWAASEDGLLHYPVAENPRQLSGLLPTEVLTEKDGLSSRVILQLFEDSRGDLWVGTLNGVTRRERSTGRWHAQLAKDLTGEPAAVETMTEDRFGVVWLGMDDQGLARFREGRFERITRGVPKGINSLFVDSRGRLWIASSRGGLGRMDHPESAEPEVRLYGAAEGMSSADLFGVGEDLYGGIYVAGGGGVDRLNPETGQVRHFTAEDGIRGEPANIGRDRTGAMWFASIYGLCRYEPRSDELNPPPPPVFHNVRVSGKRQMVSDLGESSLSAVTLQPGETGLDIEMGAVRIGPGEKMRYQYRLGEGGWSVPLVTPVISLAGLSPGRYRLVVRTIDAAGLTSADSAFMDFQAMPYFWQRWWARLLILAAALGSAAAFHRVRVGRLLELERVRSRIAADLHDDIGASLSQVAVLSEVAHRRAHDTATVQKHTEKIAAICREVVDSTSDIVWAVSPRHDSLIDLVQRMREFAEELLTARDIAFRFDVTPSTGRLRMGADMRRQSYLIFKEAVNNAARHSGATQVHIRLRMDGAWLELSVEDNGRGLANSNGNGNGLANMRRRAEAMGGVFDAGGESGGARVRVRLPVG